jgi:hypothetical protein
MDTPENYPKIIYKYRSWSDEYGKKALSEFQLYLSSPKDFNDPFDCRIPVNFKVLSKEEIILYAEKMTTKHKSTLLKRGLNLENEKSKIIQRLTTDIEKIQKENEEIAFRDYDERFGILSLSTKWDDILMWSHYGDKHYGYCLGFNEKALRDSEIFGLGGIVSYPKTREYPLIHPLKQDEPEAHFLNSHHKAIDWLYESEYRLTKFYYPNIPSKQDRQINFDPKHLAEVIIGLRTPEKHREEIIDICKANEIKVYQAHQVEFKFQIDRKEL